MLQPFRSTYSLQVFPEGAHKAAQAPYITFYFTDSDTSGHSGALNETAAKQLIRSRFVSFGRHAENGPARNNIHSKSK